MVLYKVPAADHCDQVSCRSTNIAEPLQVQVAGRLDNERAVEADFSGHSCNVLRRGDYKLCRLEREPGDRILLVIPDLEGPKSSKRLEHELALQAELDAAWAAQPVALTRYEERTARTPVTHRGRSRQS